MQTKCAPSVWAAQPRIGSQCCRCRAMSSAGTRRPVEQQVGFKIFGNLGGDRPLLIGDAVDDRIGEPRERHFAWLDLVALGVPFGRDRLRQHRVRRRQDTPRGRADGLAVELHAVTFRHRGDPGLGVEPGPQRLAHGAPCRFHGTSGPIIEQVAHRFSPLRTPGRVPLDIKLSIYSSLCLYAREQRLSCPRRPQNTCGYRCRSKAITSDKTLLKQREAVAIACPLDYYPGPDSATGPDLGKPIRQQRAYRANR